MRRVGLIECEMFKGCASCDDFNPMQREMVAQARLIVNAIYESRDQTFAESCRLMAGG